MNNMNLETNVLFYKKEQSPIDSKWQELKENLDLMEWRDYSKNWYKRKNYNWWVDRYTMEHYFPYNELFPLNYENNTYEIVMLNWVRYLAMVEESQDTDEWLKWKPIEYLYSPDFIEYNRFWKLWLANITSVVCWKKIK